MPFDAAETYPIVTAFTAPKAAPSKIQNGGWLSRLLRHWQPDDRQAPIRGFHDMPGMRDNIDVTAADLLRRAREAIADENRWVQGRYSTLDGRHCAIGALRAAGRDPSTRKAGKRAHAILRNIALEGGFGSVEQMNDRMSHGEVMFAFDRAITVAERGQASYF